MTRTIAPLFHFQLGNRVIALALAAVAFAFSTEPEIATTVAFTEGPTVDAEGNVYFTETTFHRIMRLAKDGTLTVFRENSNGANGMVIDSKNQLWICEGGNKAKGGRPRVSTIDLKTGEYKVRADNFKGTPLNQPNDITMDSKGRMYFTDFPGANPVGVYRIDPDGAVARLVAAPQIEKPNGVMISPDDKTLYLVEASQIQGGARMIRAYDLQPDGSLTKMRVFHDFYPGRSADGLCIDSKGNLYAAAGLHRRRGTSETTDTKTGIHIFAPDGKALNFLAIPEDTITNCAFGGPDLKTLYVTAGKTLFKFNNDIPGTPR